MAQSGIKFLIIDSKDRTAQSTSSTDCSFIFQPGLTCKEVEVLSLVMPMTQYNINATNNSIYFNDGSIKNFLITPGNYSVTDLITTLQATFNSFSPNGFVVSYSDVSMKLTITSTLPFSLLFGSYTTNSSAYILGFADDNTVASTSHSSDFAIDLSLPLYIYCTVDEFSTNIKSTNNFDNATFVFPNKVNSSDILLFSKQTDYEQRSKVTEVNMQALRVRWTIQGNTTLDINNNDWSLILGLHY